MENHVSDSTLQNNEQLMYKNNRSSKRYNSPSSNYHSYEDQLALIDRNELLLDRKARVIECVLNNLTLNFERTSDSNQRKGNNTQSTSLINDTFVTRRNGSGQIQGSRLEKHIHDNINASIRNGFKKWYKLTSRKINGRSLNQNAVNFFIKKKNTTIAKLLTTLFSLKGRKEKNEIKCLHGKASGSALIPYSLYPWLMFRVKIIMRTCKKLHRQGKKSISEIHYNCITCRKMFHFWSRWSKRKRKNVLLKEAISKLGINIDLKKRKQLFQHWFNFAKSQLKRRLTLDRYLNSRNIQSRRDKFHISERYMKADDHQMVSKHMMISQGSDDRLLGYNQTVTFNKSYHMKANCNILSMKRYISKYNVISRIF